jgi:two-component system response regulator HydG
MWKAELFMSHNVILIVHAEAPGRALLTSMLQTMGHRIEEASSDRVAVRMLEQGGVGLVVVGLDSGAGDGLDFLSYLRRKHPRIPVVVLLADLQPDRIREATQWGAASVLRFPSPATHLRAAVAQAMGTTDPSVGGPAQHPAAAVPVPAAPGAATASSNGTRNGHHHDEPAVASTLIGEDLKLRQAIELANTIAPTRAPVLIVGERGTGKALLARTLHQGSTRRTGPFLEVDCGAMPEAALEAELFGRQGGRGVADWPGKIAQASGGTLFLDQITALSPALQYKLLRALQGGEFEPVGGSQSARVDVRFVVASREDLASMIEWGQFRQDLYYRISVVTLNLPPLRHRGDDVERLAEHFRARFAREIGKTVTGFSAEALDALRRYSWPGNIQELENAVERAVVHCRGTRIEPAHLDIPRRDQAPTRPSAAPVAAPPMLTRRAHNPAVGRDILPLKEALEGPEKQLIVEALEALNWNRQETARVLDINRTTLYKKMKKYGLLYDEPAWVN